MAFTKIAAAGIGSTELVTLHSLEVLNNATVGGVLTYEDVTNVDSIGIVTARAGVLVGSGITLSKDGDIFATGVTTSTTFVGALTGNVTGNISGGTVAGSTGTFSGDVNISDTIYHTGDTNTKIRFPAADTFTVETGGTEAFRVTSDGNIAINDTGFASYTTFSPCLAIGDSGDSAPGLVIRGSTSSNCDISFCDNSGAEGDEGVSEGLISYDHTNDALVFHTADEERVRIKSNGNFGINTNDPNTELEIQADTDPKIRLQSKETGNKRLELYVDGGEAVGTIAADQSSSKLAFRTAGTERVRINATGQVGIGTDNPDQKLNVVDGIINVGAAVTSNDTRIQFTRKDTGIFSWVGIPNWSPSSFYIYGPKNTIPYNEVVVSYGSSEFNFFTGGTERMSIGANGHLTFQDGKRCAFNVKGSNMSRTNADNFKAEFNNDTSSGCFDSGGNFNTSSHEFEAPVSGYYFFHTTVRLDGWSSGYIRMGILSTSYHEGTTWWSIPSTGHVIKYSGDSNIDEMTTSTTMYLPATHKAYVYFVVQSETSMTVMLGESSFSGHLIG